MNAVLPVPLSQFELATGCKSALRAAAAAESAAAKMAAAAADQRPAARALPLLLAAMAALWALVGHLPLAAATSGLVQSVYSLGNVTSLPLSIGSALPTSTSVVSTINCTSACFAAYTQVSKLHAPANSTSVVATPTYAIKPAATHPAIATSSHSTLATFGGVMTPVR